MTQALTINSVKSTLHTKYMQTIQNHLEGDQDKALKFMSTAVNAIEKNPKLLECTPESLMNAVLTCAEFKFMPSNVTGQAYIIPYENQAQFQLGYQGLVTLFYRSGVKSITADIVRKNDTYSKQQGLIHHQYDPFKTKEERGEAIGAYVIITTQQGGEIHASMAKDDIIAHAKRFSQSFKKGRQDSPWFEKNDPELWMWKKTVLKQAAHLAPKDEMLYRAIDFDNQDSNIKRKKTEATVTTPEPESTEWQDKLAEKLMSMSQGEAEPQDVWFNQKLGEKYPDTEDAAKDAYTKLLNIENNGGTN